MTLVAVGVAMLYMRTAAVKSAHEEGYSGAPRALLKIDPVEIKDHKCGRTSAMKSL